MKTIGQLPVSRHFRLEQLAEGVGLVRSTSPLPPRN